MRSSTTNEELQELGYEDQLDRRERFEEILKDAGFDSIEEYEIWHGQYLDEVSTFKRR